ncbi:MAG: TonB-dependent receptor [Rudaea sp.]|uniref:TonB-dependent receptor plug domain-containing protein n=1 Tax=unclassified Rudaea TaxID=2627037 RepID=UPI0010F5EC0B|nr:MULTISPECIES: TonB-dependent receptor [unclassified Rudaea]MBN8887484.1 TonB-dependent receptor [Rudaea sp.]
MYTNTARRTLAVALTVALLSPAFARAENADANPAPADGDAQKETKKAAELEKVVVTGSRIARAEIEGPTPVTVISAETLKAQGFTTVYEVMNSLTQSFRAETPPSWGSTTVNARQVNLHGLGANRTLLLIDGRRVSDYPQPSQGGSNSYTFQNANNIPAGMIDRVEILYTGASAIYGSDAVAGVINIILKHRYEGDEFSVQTGQAERGGRRFGDFTWVGGKSGDDWHVVYSFEKLHRSALWGHDRPYTDSDSDAGYGTWSPTARKFGYQSYPGILLQAADGSYITPPAGACTQAGFAGAYRLQNSPSGYYCAQNALFKDWVLTPGRDDTDGYVYGEYDFGNGMTAYGAASIYRTTGISNTQLPFLYSMGGLPNSFYDKTTGQLIGGGSDWNGVGWNYLRQLSAREMGTQGNTYDREQNWDVHAGIKGTIFNDRFNWDASVGRSVYWVHESFTGLNEQGMFDFYFGPQQGTTTIGGTSYPVYQLDPTRFWNPISPTQYAGFGVSGRNDAISWMNQAQLTVSGDLFDLWAGPLGVAGVLEANHQGFQLYPDPRGNSTTYGNPFQNYNTGGGERTRYSSALELRIPLLSRLTATLAGRLDKYDDASIANMARTWSGALEWRPVDGVLLRGSYGTNFHAPDMIDIYQTESTQQVGIYSDYYQCIMSHQSSCPQVTHNSYFTQYSGGNPNLLPEKGHSWSAGVVWDVNWIDGLSLSADYWHTGIDNAIQNLDLTTALKDEAGCRTGLQVGGAPYTAHAQGSAYCQMILNDIRRDASGNISAAYISSINEAQFYVSGVDAAVNYRLSTDNWGDFKFGLNYTQNIKYLQRVLPTDPLLNNAYMNPRSRMNATLNWQRAGWDVTLFGQRIGGVRANGWGACVTLPDGTQPSVGDANCKLFYANIAPWITYNVSVGYDLNDHARLTVFVNNIFDRVGSIPEYSGGFEFISTLTGADYVGRELSIKLNYKF